MIDNTLWQNDMTGMPGPDMAAAGTVPVEVDPSTGQLPLLLFHLECKLVVIWSQKSKKL